MLADTSTNHSRYENMPNHCPIKDIRIDYSENGNTPTGKHLKLLITKVLSFILQDYFEPFTKILIY